MTLPDAQLRAALGDYLGWLQDSGRVSYLPLPEETSLRADQAAAQAIPPASAATRPSPISLEDPVRKGGPSDTAPAPAASGQTPLRAQAKSWTAEQKLDFLRLEVLGDCQRCSLATQRQKLVFGQGNPNARVLLVDQAPSAAQDAAGTCAVGPAMQELEAWVRAVGWRLQDLYLTNAVKCRPSDGKDPAANPAQTCRGFLQAQIRAVAPELIVALGRFAGALVLGRPGLRMNQMRGISHLYRDQKLPGREIPVVVTLHPTFVLRHAKQLGTQERASQEESLVQEDFARARAALPA